MTKEELWIEADKYVTTTGNNDFTIDAYIASAEPREKRIEELEEENRQLRNEVEDLTAYCNQIGKIKTGVLKLFEHVVAR